MLNVNVKNQIKSLEGKNFLLSEVEPNYQHNFMEVTFKANKDNTFSILDLVKFGQVYKTINYEDVKDLDIDSILVSIELKDCIYLLHEQRGLNEILKDFSSNLIITFNNNIDELTCMNEFKISEQDNNFVLTGKKYNFEDEVETDEDIFYTIDKNIVNDIEETYYGGGSDDRDVRINLTNDRYMTFQGC